MKALTKKQLFALRATIKGFTAESQDIRRKYILPSKGPERAAAWETKRALGHYARVHLLAYALMRGMKRDQLEKPSPRNKAYYNETYYLKALAKEIHQVCRYYGTYRVYWYKEMTEETILEWLQGGENTLFVYPERDDKLRLKQLTQKRGKVS